MVRLLPILLGVAFPPSERRSWATGSRFALFLLDVVLAGAADFLAEGQIVDAVEMRLVTVDFAEAGQHPRAGPHLPPEAARMAHELVGALVVERIGQQQHRLKFK